jgi:ABC-type transporter Mla subunit MlaD
MSRADDIRQASVRLAQRPLALGAVVVLIGAAIVAFAWASTNGVPFQGHYPFTVVVPASTPPLAAGDQVRIAGKIAGSVTGVHPSATTLRVDAELSSGYAPLGRGASVHVGVLLGTSLVYLVVSPGDSRHPLPAGSVIPPSRVTLSSSLPQALEAFDRAARAALGRDLTVTGEGWLGRGEQSNAAIAQLPSDLAQGTALLRSLLPSPGALAHLIAGAASVSSALRGRRPDDLGAATSASATVVSTLADHGRAAATIARLPGAERTLADTLPDADRALDSATAATAAFGPLAARIVAEDPSFEALFATGPALVDATARFNSAAPATLRALMPILPALLQPALGLPLITADGSALDDGLNAYSHELDSLATSLIAATSYTYGGVTAVRVTGTIGCVGGRDPYPAPGQAAKDRRAC